LRRAFHRQDALRARVLTAFLAADFLPAAPFVWAAFFADADRLVALRLAALLRPCADKARFDTAAPPSRFSALVLARERAADFFAVAFLAVVLRTDVPAARLRAVDFFAAVPVERVLSAARESCAAFVFVALLAVFDGFAFTPARRALDKPMAIACLAERAPCLPSRT
jgi:hypothetical protein